MWIGIWKMENVVHSWIHAPKDTWDLGASGLSECVEGCWRDWNHAKKKQIQDWLELNGDPGLQFLTGEKIAAVIFFIYFYQHYQQYIIQFSIYLFSYFFCLLGLSFASLIRMISTPKLIRIREGLLYFYQFQLLVLKLIYFFVASIAPVPRCYKTKGRK
jgi:hypothetical protein